MEGTACREGELVDAAARGARELDRGEVVMRAQLGLVVVPAERVDPLHGEAVLLRPLGPRDLPVGDVADEEMAECVLVLALD